MIMRTIFLYLGILILMSHCQVQSDQVHPVQKEVKKKSDVRLLFAGDLLLDRGVKARIERKGLKTLFEGVDSIINQHDFFIVNMETPITQIESPLNKKFIFRSDPKHLSTLKAVGVSHAILSNNHSMDQNKEGLLDTYHNLIQSGIEPIGGGRNKKEACEPTLIQKEGHTIAIFGSVSIPIENWFPIDNQPSVCQLNHEEMIEHIANYRETNPDVKVVVTLHWGLEYLSTPTVDQINHAKKIIDAGADVIIGHHPHVIQTIQEYKGKMIYYSIGNFIFDSKHPKSKKALLISLNINANGEISCQDIPIQIQDCKPVPNYK